MDSFQAHCPLRDSACIEDVCCWLAQEYPLRYKDETRVSPASDCIHGVFTFFAASTLHRDEPKEATGMFIDNLSVSFGSKRPIPSSSCVVPIVKRTTVGTVTIEGNKWFRECLYSCSSTGTRALISHSIGHHVANDSERKGPTQTESNFETHLTTSFARPESCHNAQGVHVSWWV